MTALGPEDYPPGWCFHHETVHGPMEWSDLCQSPDDTDDQFTRRHHRFRELWDSIDRDEQDRKRRRWGRLKWWTVCVWAHRTRQVAPGVWKSNHCWACSNGA